MHASGSRALIATLAASACLVLLACEPAAQQHSGEPPSQQDEKQAADPLLVIEQYQALIQQGRQQQPGAETHARQLAQLAAAASSQAEHEDRVTRSRCCVGRAAFQCRLDGGADVYGVPSASWILIDGTQLCRHDASTGQVSSP